ncbi:hypothetical protein H6F53_04120 [Trichocoleus sp. FACHB-832]|uniref:hypothetical protein n=1 Tax=Trichocoleus sp. FACHB-832 TaxID=2692875 RepID=UPI0016822B89|nr:hypothetical protein [Trichocoleus sp. FACHB-832]MBD1904681.1 hypothetical protein [Trichocoleus sp. FACHB-832]
MAIRQAIRLDTLNSPFLAGWFHLLKENFVTLIFVGGRGMAMPCPYKMLQFSIFSKGCMKPPCSTLFFKGLEGLNLHHNINRDVLMAVASSN